MTPIAILGDAFLLPELFAEALHRRLPGRELDLRPTSLPWPDVPFGPVAEVVEASGTEDEVVAAIGDAEVCLTQMAAVTEGVLARTPALRLICVARGGPVNVNLDAARDHGVRVVPTEGRNAGATAEHAVTLMLAAARRIVPRHEELARGEWRSDYYRFDRCGPEIGQSVVGLVGYGAVGSRVARIVRAMGARVVVYDPYAAAASIDPADQRVDTLADLLAASDIVSLHARLTADNHRLLGAAELAALRPGAIVVNTARGPLLDYDALCDSLDAGHLFGAAVDVFDPEPPAPTARVRRTANLVLTPHLAGATQHTARYAADRCADAVADYLAAAGVPTA